MIKEYANGTKEWYSNGKRHREDGAAIEYADGTKEWWMNGRLHRIGAPAIEYAFGAKYWYMNGKLHRTDGPAVELLDGHKQWCIGGIHYANIVAWARAALHYECIEPMQQNVDAKIAQVMQHDLFD